MGKKRRKKKKRPPPRAKGDVQRRKIKRRPPAEKRIISKSKGEDKKKDKKKAAARPITGWRLWLFRIIALTVIPAALFLLVELGLRIAGYGYPTGTTINFKANGESYYGDNVKFAWRFFPRNIARESDAFIFSQNKPQNGYRIFVLGASAAKGEPDAAFCFGRFLKEMLRAQYPAVNFEVITIAMAAINSHVVLEIAKDCVQHEADMFIVYLGNNEVAGPYGAGTIFAPLSGNLSLIRTGIALRTTRFGQLLESLLKSTGAGKDKLAVWRGMEMFLEQQVLADDPRLETVYQHFDANLKDISRVLHNSGAKIIFCTVGSNLKDSPPFASQHSVDLTESEKKKWDDVYQQGVEYETAGIYAEAAESYLAAAGIDDCVAELQFRLGRCYWDMAEYDKARERYIRARELDTLRFRADTRINEIIRSVAANKTAEGIYLVDTVKALEDNSPHGTAGNELFYEHVHLNFKGSYLLARTIFEQVKEILPERIKRQQASNSKLLTEQECAERMAYTDWDRQEIVDEVLNGFIKRAPFINQLYHKQRVQEMEQRLKALQAGMNEEALEKAAAQYRNAIENDDKDWFLHWKYGKLLAEDMKDYEAAAEQYRFVQRLVPHSYTGYNSLGSVLRGMGDLDGAIAQYHKAIEIKPTCEDAHYYLGWAYQKQGRIKEAIEYYSKAVRWQPDCVPAYNNLGEILYRQGKVDEAVEICRKGLLFVPNSSLLHCNLGTLLNMQGNRDEALKELRRALELDPNSAKIRNVLETVLRRRD